MFTQSVENIVETAVGKRDKMNESLPKYFLAALLAGAYFSDIYLSLVLFSITQSLILLYNLQWMLKALKERKK